MHIIALSACIDPCTQEIAGNAITYYDISLVQFPASGLSQVLVCLFPGVLWLWHFLFSIGPHPVSSLHIYTFVVSRVFMTGAPSQAGDADSTRAPGLTSGLQGSVNVHRGALLLVPQWQCISSFVLVTWIPSQFQSIALSLCRNIWYPFSLLEMQPVPMISAYWWRGFRFSFKAWL